MNSKILILALLAIFTVSFQLAPPPPVNMSESEERPDRSQMLAAAREMILQIRFCALITVDADGAPRVRTMDPFPPDEDWIIHMATNASTRKIDQIRNNPRSALYYFDSSGIGYVSLEGTSRLVSEASEKARFWKPDWTPFYEDQYRGDDYVLIEFRPSRLEIVSASHGIASSPKSWRPAAVDFPEEQP